MNPVEFIKDMFLILFCHTDTLILYQDLDPAIDIKRTDGDFRWIGGVFICIVEQIVDHI